MLKVSPSTISAASVSPESAIKGLVRTALLACLIGAGNPGCAVHSWGYVNYPCVPPLPTVTTVGRRPYYFARPLAPIAVVVSPSHGHFLCP